MINRIKSTDIDLNLIFDQFAVNLMNEKNVFISRNVLL